MVQVSKQRGVTLELNYSAISQDGDLIFEHEDAKVVDIANTKVRKGYLTPCPSKKGFSEE